MPSLIRKILEETSAKAQAEYVASGLDVVGDLAVLRLTDLDEKAKVEVAEALLKEVKNVKGVYEQEGGIEGEFRLRRLRHLAGDRRTTTVHRENGFFYELDLASCYFSPRLSTERLRVSMQVKAGERVLNMFAGVGPFTVPIARKNPVVSCELNPSAFEYHERNNARNKVSKSVRMLNADAKLLPELVSEKFDRIIMPHPSKAEEFLGAALAVAGESAIIHYYRHLPGMDESEAGESIKKELNELLPRKCSYAVRRVRAVGPRWLEMAAEISLGAQNGRF
ncbi:MAG TPA: class I SAM-dependent methyltransferase family protein [Nitrososphaerales archaeon]|nr:class I SAM-dependent methyltransferase family protein [Nitrososphaerales archaeon]